MCVRECAYACECSCVCACVSCACVFHCACVCMYTVCVCMHVWHCEIVRVCVWAYEFVCLIKFSLELEYLTTNLTICLTYECDCLYVCGCAVHFTCACECCVYVWACLCVCMSIRVCWVWVEYKCRRACVRSYFKFCDLENVGQGNDVKYLQLCHSMANTWLPIWWQ